MTRKRNARNVFVELNAMRRVSIESCFTSAMIRHVHSIMHGIAQIEDFKKQHFDMQSISQDPVDMKYSMYCHKWRGSNVDR
jgi:hypothetical protein